MWFFGAQEAFRGKPLGYVMFSLIGFKRIIFSFFFSEGFKGSRRIIGLSGFG